jgi:hypothetical protein
MITYSFRPLDVLYHPPPPLMAHQFLRQFLALESREAIEPLPFTQCRSLFF